jgi:hypothetical protein
MGLAIVSWTHPVAVPVPVPVAVAAVAVAVLAVAVDIRAPAFASYVAGVDTAGQKLYFRQLPTFSAAVVVLAAIS